MSCNCKIESKIFVIYLGIAGIRSEDIEDYKNKISKRIIPQSVKGEFIIIPTNSFETKMVCINPVYITDKKLIEEHTLLISELNKELAIELKQIKNEKEN